MMCGDKNRSQVGDALDRPLTDPYVLLFDIDGTLIDSGGAGGGALLAALQQEFCLATARPVRLHGRTDSGIMAELLATHGEAPNADNVRRLSTAYLGLLPGVLAQRRGRVLPGVQALLTALQACDRCHLGLLTGNMPHSARMKLEHFGLWSFFKMGVYGDLAAERPGLCDPALAMVAQLAGAVEPRRVIVVGDTPLDIELASAMQVRSLAVCTGGFAKQELQQAGADYVVDDLSRTEEILAWCLADPQEKSSQPPLGSVLKGV